VVTPLIHTNHSTQPTNKCPQRLETVPRLSLLAVENLKPLTPNPEPRTSNHEPSEKWPKLRSGIHPPPTGNPVKTQFNIRQPDSCTFPLEHLHLSPVDVAGFWMPFCHPSILPFYHTAILQVLNNAFYPPICAIYPPMPS